MATKRTHTTRDVATIKQLHDGGQLVLATEFQRDAVWPREAKAYLLDTVLSDRPVPYLYFRRTASAQTGKTTYEVVDGQQRVRALLEFLAGKIALTESKDKSFRGKRFDELTAAQRQAVLTYDLYVEELTGYSDADIRDMFVRMNRFVVKLSPPEIRHAKFEGRFKDYVEGESKKPFWLKNRVFSIGQLKRGRAVEFVAELVILLREGPQDKKAAVDLYYGRYEKSLPFRSEVDGKLERFFAFILSALPHLPKTRWRRPTDLYALVGALAKLTEKRQLKTLDASAVGRSLRRLEEQINQTNPTGEAATYKAAASRQTDNLTPRSTRIAVLEKAIRNA